MLPVRQDSRKAKKFPNISTTFWHELQRLQLPEPSNESKLFNGPADDDVRKPRIIPSSGEKISLWNRPARKFVIVHCRAGTPVSMA
jgi:hypothetical protein